MISLTKKNVESYISIFNESFYDVPNSKTYHAEAVLALNEDKNREFYIVAYNDQYVGTLEFEIKKIYKTGIIKAIAVKRNYQQKGFATILMQLALIHLKESGCHQIELIVSSINIKVKNLYEKFGFQNEEIISKWYVSTKKDYESLYYYKTSVGL